MKKTVRVVLLLAAVALITACGGSNNPKDVAIQFTKHLINGEYEKAAELGTADTQQLITFMAAMVDEKTMKKTSSGMKIKHISTEIDGDTAVVVLSTGLEEKPVALRKVDGKWLVELEKDTMNMDKDIFNQ